MTKAKVTMEGETVLRALHDVIAAKGYEKNTMFREVAQFIGTPAATRGHGACERRAGAEVHAELHAQPRRSIREIPIRNDAADDTFFWNQGPTRGAGKVQFADWTPVYEQHAGIPNVAVFYDQAKAFRELLLTAAPDADQQKDLDFLLNVGHLFSLIVYGQLILEQAALTGLDDDMLDQIFDFQVRDFNTYAVALHGKPTATHGPAGLGAERDPQAGARRRALRPGLGAGEGLRRRLRDEALGAAHAGHR